MAADQGNPVERIHIAVGFDENYLHPVYSLISSLIIHHRAGQVEIHALTQGITEKEKFNMTEFVGHSGNRISFYTLDRSLVSQFVLTSQWTSAVYYRLFFTSLIPEKIQRLIYLDSDTVVTNSLWPLYNVAMDDFPVAAVFDNYVKTQPLINIFEEGEYFNSGVMLIDVEKWKAQKISEQACEYLQQYPQNILFVDQCALNKVLRSKWKKLDFRFNLMYSCLPEDLSKKQMRGLVKNSVVVHYTLQRPWHMLCKNRLRNLYFYYIKRAGVIKLPWLGYSDFEIKKIPAWIKIRLQDFYFDVPVLRKFWRFIHIR
ncbi:MAG: glycosyltransferase family 8 protein [Cyclobacteriaceae bacterium]